jgi:hypothetical protein
LDGSGENVNKAPLKQNSWRTFLQQCNNRYCSAKKIG